ncbi:OmpA family protein [uncultured Brevibacterium sp.]|uniref:OmpA family protein n=1 Tax=uncultured Brevibacterium sp. TaxID=189678 RepID=UPI0025DD5EAC|nr:OmpA family protein [uncultured Brevibacterium sp.]
MRPLAILAIVAVALTGCIPGQSKGDNGGNQQPPAPAMEKSDGFWRPNTLGEPLAKKVIERPTDDGPAKARLEVLSLDSDGKSARMVAAWLPPVEGNFLEGSELQTELATVSDMPFVRLLDFKNQELQSSYEGEKLQYSDNFKNEPNPQPTGPDEFQRAYSNCTCSNIPKTEEYQGEKPESVPLFYADFPAPSSDSVGIAFGDNAAVLTDVKLSENQRYEAPKLTEIDYRWAHQEDLSNPYGGGAIFERRFPMSLVSESVMDTSVSDRGDSSALNVSADVLFDFDSDKVKDSDSKLIDGIADELKKSAAGQKVTIEGHTDDEGDEKYNVDLSNRRAESVKKVLEPKVDGSGISFETKGFGESQPILPNRTASGDAIKKNQAKNRRVSFNYKPQGDIDPNVDTGKKISDLEKMKPGDSTDALASGIVSSPKDSDAPEMQLDVKEIEEYGEFLKVIFDLRTASGQDVERAFTQGANIDGNMAFGNNPVTHYRDTPTTIDMQLWDKSSNLLAHSVTAGPLDCLCSRSVRPTDKDKARGETVEMFAFFPKKGITSDTLTLRVGGKSQLEFNRTQSAGAPNSSTPRPSTTAQG